MSDLASPPSLDEAGARRLVVEQVEADIERHQRLLESPGTVLRRLFDARCRQAASAVESGDDDDEPSRVNSSPLPRPPARLVQALRRDGRQGDEKPEGEEGEEREDATRALRERVRGMLLDERGVSLVDDESEVVGDETDGEDDDRASASSGSAPSLHFAADLGEDGALPGEEGFGFAAFSASAEVESGSGRRGDEEEERRERRQRRRKQLPPHPLSPHSRISELARPKQKVFASPSAAEEEAEAAAASAAAAAASRRRRRGRFSSLSSSLPVEERLFAAAARREEKLELARARAAREEVEGCSFAPRIRTLSSSSAVLLGPGGSEGRRPPLHERAAALAAAASQRRLAASLAPPPFPFSPEKMSARSREIVERAAEAASASPLPPASPSRHSRPHAAPLPPPFAPRINRHSESLVLARGMTFDERREAAERARAGRLAAAAERSAASTIGAAPSDPTRGVAEGGRFFPAGAAAVLRRERHGQIGAPFGRDDGGETSSPIPRKGGAFAAAARAAEAAAEAEAAARPFPLHSPALCRRSLLLAERARRGERGASAAKGGGGRKAVSVVAPGAAGAEALARAGGGEAGEWSPAAGAEATTSAAAAAASERGGKRDGRRPPRDPDASVLLAARARKAARAAEAAARAAAEAEELERECTFRPSRATAAAAATTAGAPTAAGRHRPSSTVYRPPCAGRTPLAADVVPGAASHLLRAERARRIAEEERERAEAAFFERPRARRVATRPLPFSLSENRDPEGGGGRARRHPTAFEEERLKCPFRPSTRAAEDARLVRELLLEAA